MRFFYYTWYENSADDLKESLSRLGFQVVKCHIPLKNYEEDADFCENFVRIFREQGCDIMISFDFFPIIAKIAEQLDVRYLSWVYDMPHHTIYSPAVLGSHTSLFLFDREQYAQMQRIKPDHTYYLPLAVHADRINRQLKISESGEGYRNYDRDISFVGSLYEHNLYRQISYLPEYLRGYLQGIMQAQQKIYGYHMIEDVVDEAVFEELQKYVIMDLDPSYFADRKQLYVDMLDAEITCQERTGLLEALSERYQVDLYTASDAALVPHAHYRGTVSYGTEMPELFRTSRINLNITLRSIRHGIPLRALDIMGAGGFLLSNYQPALAEEFVDGSELVLFESREDLLEKTAYYLEHEEERREIALRGWRKVQQEFTYDTQLRKMLTMSGLLTG